MPQHCCSFARDLINSNTEETFHDVGGKSFTLVEDTPASYAPDLKLEPIHSDIHLSFDQYSLKTHTFTVCVVHDIRCNQPESSLELNAMSFEDVTVKDVTNSGTNDLSFRYDGKQIKLNWKDNLKANEIRKVEIAYTVNDPVSSVCWNYENNTNRRK
jgi:hypothetical protein